MRRLLLLALVPAFVACGSSSNSSSPYSTSASSSAAAGAAASSSSGGAAAAGTITIQNFKFSPNPVKAKVGDTITVTNNDGTNHSVTADDKSFDTTPFSSGSKTITVSKAGTIKFHCEIHSTMTGEIDVS